MKLIGFVFDRIVIHIKAGAYLENLEVIKKKRNVMLVGDGIGKTVVKGSRNVIDGWTTFQSATVGAFQPLFFYIASYYLQILISSINIYIQLN